MSLARKAFCGPTSEHSFEIVLIGEAEIDFVYVPAPDRKFRRVEVVGGDLLTDDVSLQEVKSGLQPGQQVVTNALTLDHVLAQ